MKSVLLFIFISISASSFFAQTAERIKVKGEVSVPEDFDAGGINIFNQSSGRGTISSGKGEFELEMKAGDTLLFSAVQFETLKVAINQDIIDFGHLRVEISEGLNELPEIFIKPHELSGNLSEDIKNVEVTTLVLPPMSSWNAAFPDEGASPKNAAMNEIGGGANHYHLLVKAVNFLFPKRKKRVKDKDLSKWAKIDLEKELRTTYNDSFFMENLTIPASEVSAFLNFCMEKGIEPDLLRKNRELELLQVLMQYSQEYQQRITED